MKKIALILLAGAAVVAPRASEAQQNPVVTLADTADLVFEREVFAYPGYERRNPFLPLVDAAAGGPRFEELDLLGIVHHGNARLSVALFGVGDVRDGGSSAGGGGGGGSPGFETFRLRRGDIIGNTRILEIQEDRVIVEVEEFGLAERRVLELPRADEGGSS